MNRETCEQTDQQIDNHQKHHHSQSEEQGKQHTHIIQTHMADEYIALFLYPAFVWIKQTA